MKSIPTPLPEPKIFTGKLAIQQRVLPSYRVPFFDILAQQCEQGATLYAGQARKSEMIKAAQKTDVIQWHRGKNLHFLKSPFYLCWQKGNLEWLKEENPDVLITEANPRYLSTDRLIRWMHAKQRPVIGWGLGAPPVSGPLSKLRGQRRKKFLQKFDALLAYSENGAQEYIQLGIPADRVFTAYNAVAPAHPKMPPRKAPTFASQPIVLFVGRLQARKRLDLLIQACANLPKEQQPQLWIVGDGPARAEAENALKPTLSSNKILWGNPRRSTFRNLLSSRFICAPWHWGPRHSRSHGTWLACDRSRRGWHAKGSCPPTKWLANHSQ